MDQAERLRELVGRSESRARVLTIASGKGGVGKTNFAVNLAVALVKLGKRVILIDVDIGLANADVLLGVQPKLHLGHVLAGEISVLDALVPAAGGVLLLPGCTNSRHISDLERTERDFLVRSFQQVEAYADFVLIDTGAGISKNVIQFAVAADEALVLTTPEPTAIADSYAVIKSISREKGYGRIRLVVNQALNAFEAARVAERVRMVARRFLGIEVDDLGHIPSDECVTHAVRQRRPFLLQRPRSSASQSMRAIAEKICGEGQAGRSGGFFQRFRKAISNRARP